MGNTGLHTAPVASGSRKKKKRSRKKKNRSPSPVASSGVSTPEKRQKQKRSASPVNEAASVESCHAAAPSADRGPADCSSEPNSPDHIPGDCAGPPADCDTEADLGVGEECECVPLPHGCTEVKSGEECAPPPADCGTEANPVEECVPLPHGCTEVNSGAECAPPPAGCGTEATPVEECVPLPHGCTEVKSGEEFSVPAEGITEVNSGGISAPKKKGNLRQQWQQRRRAPEKWLTWELPRPEHQEQIQSSPAAAGLSKIAHDNGEQPAQIINNEEIEGFYWSDAYLEEAIRCYKEQVNLRLPDIDDVFWSSYDGQELKQLNERLAMHRIKAHEISKGALLERLVDAKLEKEYPRAIFEDSEYYECYEMDFEWYFDPEYIRFVGFEDYQRLVLRETDYLHWDKYRETYCTYKADQEFVEFYEKLSSKTKWLANALSVRNHEERLRYQRLAFYEAVKIAAGFKNIRLALVYTCVSEYIWSVEYERSTYGPIASLYFEIWKRVAKEKMSFVHALKQVYDEDICVPCRFEMKLELDYGPKSGPMKINYDDYVAYVSSRVPENEAHLKIMEAVKKFVPKQKTYYDYARKKLDIARKIGVIPLQKATC